MVDPGTLARLSLFAGLGAPQLEAVAAVLDDASFPRGARVIREGFDGEAFYVITAGEAAVQIDGQERARLRPGDFFGEVSILTGDVTGADVVAETEELRCAVLAGAELVPLLRAHPELAVQMLTTSARRLQSANLWSG
ncbi:MAG TPA: cyclic nucleotide-binding domain-containing protein [Gaiellaceae bacterium]|nr:cyclic nucleotide-binding domain-containing protein [Gaiellaceae bacterium]